MKFVSVCFVLVAACLTLGYGSNILGVFHTISKSRYFVGSTLMLELASRGHQVTTLSPYHLDSSVTNYTEIVTNGVLETIRASAGDLSDVTSNNPIKHLRRLYRIANALTKATLEAQAFKTLLKSDSTFDVILLDVEMSEVMLGLGHQFNAPIILLSTSEATPWTCDLVGSPAPFSYIPHPTHPLTDNMNYYERISNVILTTIDKIYYNFVFFPSQEELYNSHFADPKPSLQDLRKNVSLVLLNSHFTLHYPRPHVPNVIEVGGLHVNRSPKPVPKDLQRFMDNANDGVIYVSMGSDEDCQDLSNDKLSGIMRAFSTLHEKVIWNCELNQTSELPKNVLAQNWIRQNVHLAHPNLRLFITHGDLLSTTEAIYQGIPIIGIPKFADQYHNMAFVVRAGVAIQIDFNELTEFTLNQALDVILSNSNYHEKAKILSNRFRDQPHTPLESAVYWVEYVIRHRGAPHIRSRGQDLSFIKYHSLDTIGILIVGVLILNYILVEIVKKIFIFSILFYLNLNVNNKVK